MVESLGHSLGFPDLGAQSLGFPEGAQSLGFPDLGAQSLGFPRYSLWTIPDLGAQSLGSPEAKT
jgi:O-acetyl-ADP-ribose deacetylase (regulator of RNase III)